MKPELPPEQTLVQGMADVLVDTGLYSAVAITRTIGNHYNPSEAAWTMLVCYQFALPGGAEGSNCVDSFKAFKLDNGNWVVAVTIDDVYRWRAISVTPAGQNALTPAGTRQPAPAGTPATQLRPVPAQPVSTPQAVPAPKPQAEPTQSSDAEPNTPR